MSGTTRPAMRLLSPRCQCTASKPSPCLRQLRPMSSRYSNPAKRTVTTAQSLPSFTLSTPRQPTLPEATIDPLDARTAQLAQNEKRQYHLRRMRFAGMGLILSLVGLAMVLYNLDIDDMEQAEKKRRGQQLDASNEANERFQGKEVHIIGAGDGKRIVAQGEGGDIDLVETGTSSVPHFPRTIYLPTSSDSKAATSNPGVVGTAQPNTRQNPGNTANQEEYTLIGLGIRTVLFIQVYVVGMYVRTTDISTLQQHLIHSINPTASTLIPAEKETLEKNLLDPTASRDIWASLLQVSTGLKTAWRIAPTRNTDFGHLRDGFVNGINARTQEARRLLPTSSTATQSEYDAEDFGHQSARPHWISWWCHPSQSRVYGRY